jgi:hypothetical protein
MVSGSLVTNLRRALNDRGIGSVNRSPPTQPPRDRFLARSGRHLDAPEADFTATMMALAAGQAEETDFAAWLRDHTRP